jgi:hypothetical protein
MDDILEQILQVQPVLHTAGTVSVPALREIAAHAGRRTILRSAETGCGATTLLLSHLSRNHTVFALDVGDSVSSVRNSPLLRPGVTTFVDGPSQQTLPNFRFGDKLQLALIDGPHAYPFPDLEYYYLYPQLEPGALLVLDDIQIRSIHNLFDFLRGDAMFRLDAVVRTTALFTRTDAPTFDPLSDCWEQQGYNRRTLWRYDWRSRLGRTIPRSLRPSLTKRSKTLVEIVAPNPGSRVGASGNGPRYSNRARRWPPLGACSSERRIPAGGRREAVRSRCPAPAGAWKSGTVNLATADIRSRLRPRWSAARYTNAGCNGSTRRQ